MSRVILSVNNINKSFGIVKALNDVSFEIREGEIRGLIGENGSGKSTVSWIISGMLAADSGKLFLEGTEYDPKSLADARKRGISMIVQEIGTIASMTVAQNIFIGQERKFRKGGLINKQAMRKDAQNLLNALGLDYLDAGKLTGSLSLEDRKLVEIARAMQNNPKILIVDETTTALSHTGREFLFECMKKQIRQGNAVLFISHDVDELIRTCDVLTVLRDGAMVGTLNKEEMTPQAIKKLMVGREISDKYYRDDYEPYSHGELALKAENISHEKVLSNFSLELYRGEILGVGGLSSCGMHELGKLLFGAEPAITGEITVCPSGDRITDIRSAIMHHIGYVSKNRDEEVLVLQNSIGNNLTVSALHQLSRHGWISYGSEKGFSKRIIDEFSIKCYGANQDVSTLSGGNKQKVAFGKWIGNDSDILIFDCPTRGVDIGVKTTMYELLGELRKEGKAIIMISEELPELIGMCDRLLILKDGHLVKELLRSPDLTEHEIIEYMI